MTETGSQSLLERAACRFEQLAEGHNLLGAELVVHARALTPDEAIGQTGRRDFPLVEGRERIVEARVLGRRGHAFTDSPGEFRGSVADVLALGRARNRERAVYVATMNAVLASLGLVERPVHCRDEAPACCGRQIATSVGECPEVNHVGLVGLNPAIADELVRRFGRERVCIADLDRARVGRRQAGVPIWDGRTDLQALVERSDAVLISGTTLVNDTLDSILARVHERHCRWWLYGVTAAGACALLDLPRLCPCSLRG